MISFCLIKYIAPDTSTKFSCPLVIEWIHLIDLKLSSFLAIYIRPQSIIFFGLHQFCPKKWGGAGDFFQKKPKHIHTTSQLFLQPPIFNQNKGEIICFYSLISIFVCIIFIFYVLYVSVFIYLFIYKCNK